MTELWSAHLDINLVFLLNAFCGLLGIWLRRNALNVIVSFYQLVLGALGLFFLPGETGTGQNKTALYLILFLGLTIVVFLYSVITILIRRRSTLNINELTELRG